MGEKNIQSVIYQESKAHPCFFLTSRLKENTTRLPTFILIKDGKNHHQPGGRPRPLPPKGARTGHPGVAGTTERLTHRPPVLGVLREAHGASPRRVNRHYNHRLDYVVSNRPTVSNHSSAPLNAEYPSLSPDRCIGEADTLASWALMGTATRS